MKMPSCVRMFAISSMVVAIAACTPTHHVTTETPSYDPTVSARMRILTGNDLQSASFRPGTCYTPKWQNDPQRINVDDGFLSRYKYSSRSVTIGMPPSPRPAMRIEGLHFKDLIREYVVDAGKPLTLSMSTAGGTDYDHWSCSATDVSFTPVAGQDYDVFLALERSGRRSYSCSITIHRIDANGLDEPVESRYAPKCPAAPDAGENKTAP